jgi:hypothetical protein
MLFLMKGMFWSLACIFLKFLVHYVVACKLLTMSGFHKLCGINPDQHFYLHLNKEMDFQHLDFTITSVAAGKLPHLNKEMDFQHLDFIITSVAAGKLPHLNKEMDFQHLDFTITSVAAGRSLFFL